jgi:heme oxygenase
MQSIQPPSAADPPASILSRLRDETAMKHKQLEEGIDLLSPSLTVERYAGILRFFWAAFAPWENAIESSCPSRYRALWQGRNKVFRIANDLHSLGMRAEPPPAAPCTPPLLDQEAVWLGSLYVMEGSTLGGQYIARHLQQRFAWPDGYGCSFFRPYGIMTAQRWQAVRSALGDSTSPANRILGGAHQSYDYLACCLHHLHDIDQSAPRSKSDKL